MKKKRLMCCLILGIVFTLMAGFTAMATASGSVSAGSNLDIILNGHITFVKGLGVNLFPDKVTYQAAINGRDTYMVVLGAQDVRVYVTPGTDSYSLGTQFIYYPSDVVSGTNVPCGTSGTYAQMAMYCVGNTKTIVDYGN